MHQTIEGDIEPALTRHDVSFYSVYRGRPGAYRWVADFADPDVADFYAQQMAKNGADLDRAQFDLMT